MKRKEERNEFSKEFVMAKMCIQVKNKEVTIKGRRKESGKKGRNEQVFPMLWLKLAGKGRRLELLRRIKFCDV